MITPPTDNLYKFCAIVGIILVVFNSYYNLEMKIETGNELTKLIGEQKKLLIKSKNHEENLIEFKKILKNDLQNKSQLTEEVKHHIKLAEQNKLSKEELIEISSKIDKSLNDKEFTKKIDSINKIIKKEGQALEFEKIEIETKHELISRQETRTEIYSTYMWFGIITGLILSVFGFVNWWKIQKEIDKQQIKNNQ